MSAKKSNSIEKKIKRKAKSAAKKQVKKHKFVILKVLCGIVVVLGGTYAGLLITNNIKLNNLLEYVDGYETRSIKDDLTPTVDQNGYYTFTTDRDFKIMQLTDIHIGSGFLSTYEDHLAFDAMEAMIKYENPDLVVVTGDMTFAIPHIAGSINNYPPANAFGRFMEKMGVYWTVTLGNHDSEIYSYYNRDIISHLYSNPNIYPHCLASISQADNVDGYLNHVINIKNSSGIINKSLIMLDSNTYPEDNKFGLKGTYDNVHPSQINWYKNVINNLSKQNSLISGDAAPIESFVFQHIPPQEYQKAYEEFVNAGFKDTENVKYYFGDYGDKVNEEGVIVCAPYEDDQLFETMLELNSTKAMFVGHDHLNTASVDYKGIRLTYGMSIDNLAYSNIKEYGRQRGCTLINVKNDKTFTIEQQNYYQEKYVSRNPKYNVTFDHYYDNDKNYFDNNLIYR